MPRERLQFFGYSIRSPGFRYTEWHPFDPDTGVANWTTLVGVELYLHGDRGSQEKDCSWDYEHTNRAEDPSLKGAREALAGELRSIVSSDAP